MVVGLDGLPGPFAHPHVKMLKVECKFENEAAQSPNQPLGEVNVKAIQFKQQPAVSCHV